MSHIMRKLTFWFEADQHLYFRCIDNTIPLLSKSKISSLKPSSVLVQLGSCQTCSETTLFSHIMAHFCYQRLINFALLVTALLYLPLSNRRKCHQNLQARQWWRKEKQLRKLIRNYQLMLNINLLFKERQRHQH